MVRNAPLLASEQQSVSISKPRRSCAILLFVTNLSTDLCRNNIIFINSQPQKTRGKALVEADRAGCPPLLMSTAPDVSVWVKPQTSVHLVLFMYLCTNLSKADQEGRCRGSLLCTHRFRSSL